MAGIDISIPDDGIGEWLETQAASEGFESVQEYVLHLLRRERSERAAADERLAGLLREGVESGPATEMTQADWDDVRRDMHARLDARQSK